MDLGSAPHANVASATGSAGTVVRPARPSDLRELVALERLCFETDRLSQRSFNRFLIRAHASLFVVDAEDRPGLLGYGLVLFHRGTALARLYALAVHPDARGRGVARSLLDHADEETRRHDGLALRLEVRADNPAAIGLYRRSGYRPFGIRKGYYEDGADALRMQKPIRYLPDAAHPNVPYRHQTTDFTCGPASLLMAMAAQTGQAAAQIDPHEELRIWREATTVFMTSGHGGCGPHGLALAADRRGHRVRTIVSVDGSLFVDTVRDAKKKAMITRVHAEVLHDFATARLTVEHGPVTADLLEAALRDGWIPVLLISTYLFNREKAPHWVVVTGVDRRVVLVHDPDMDEDLWKSDVDCVHVPIRRADFERVARYGRDRLQAAVLVGPRIWRRAADA